MNATIVALVQSLPPMIVHQWRHLWVYHGPQSQAIDPLSALPLAPPGAVPVQTVSQHRDALELATTGISQPGMLC